jgi:hypothetical protein
VAVAWAGSLVLLTLFALSVIPAQVAFLQKAKNAVLNSYSYALMKQYLFKEVPLMEEFTVLASLPEGETPLTSVNTQQIEALRSSQEFQAVYQNEGVQQMIQDEELMKDLQDKNLTAILQSPKIQNLLQDKELMQDLKELYLRFLKESPPPELPAPE